MDEQEMRITHTRKIYAGGGYKIPQYYQKGGCYREKIASSLIMNNLERKEVSACSIHRDNS